jgi:hypothetical protein
MTLFRLTDTVLVQDGTVDSSIVDRVEWADIKGEPVADTHQLGHVVNWFEGDAEAMAVQAATARTMQRSRLFARDSLDARLIACTFEDELSAAPAEFQHSPPLTRSILDVHSFRVPRRLAILSDVLQSGALVAPQAGYLVFTNADICLMPHFYTSVQGMLARGIDSIIINRRTVGALSAYGQDSDIAMIETGGRHPGLDCFVFPVRWVTEFVCSDACIGAGWVMRSLLYNLVARAQRMLIMRDAHLTYHFGDDRIWSDLRQQDYLDFNLEQARFVMGRLSARDEFRAQLAAFCDAHAEPLRPA